MPKKRNRKNACAVLLALSALLLMTGAIRAVSLDIGPGASAVAAGWQHWRVPGGDGRGPFTHRVEQCPFDADGFSVTIGPANALGCRTGPTCTGPSAAVIEESVFTHAETPMVVALEGLPAGRYRLLLWFNDSRGYQWPPLTVTADDAEGENRRLISDQPQTAVIDTRKCTVADTIVHADGARPVKLTCTIAQVHKTYIFLSGIEILPQDSIGRPLHPWPAQGASDQPLDVTLSWHSSPEARMQTLWVGSSPDALLKRQGDLTEARVELRGLTHNTTVYWRVDNLCDNSLVQGPVWHFTTRSGKAERPFPADGETGVSVRPEVSWQQPLAATGFRVYAGESPEKLQLACEDLQETICRLPRCDWGRWIFWRVDSVTERGIIEGDVWRFQVDQGEPRRPIPPHGAADIPSDTALRWACPRGGATYDIWLGDSPRDLEQVATGLSTAEFQPRLAPNKRIFWRVSAADQASPIWSFVTSSQLVLEDAESYDAVRRVEDVWDDRRAQHPDDGPVVAVTGGNRRALLFSMPAGKRTVDRPAQPHTNWVLPHITHISMRLQKMPSGSSIRFRLCDTDGAVETHPLPVTKGPTDTEAWSEVRLPLAVFTSVDLRRVSRFGFEIETAQPVSCRLDDLVLTGSGKAEAAALAHLEMGSLVDNPAAFPGPAVPDPAPAGETVLACDVCVVGGGSGGIGAALAAAREGANVILIEQQSMLAGTSTAGGISNWEPGPGCALAEEIYRRLRHCRNAVISDKQDYKQTLTRASRGHIQFEPDAFHQVVSSMLRDTGTARILLGTTCVESAVNRDGPRMTHVNAVGPDGERFRIKADFFIDSTGGAFLCQAAGCEVMLGVEPKSRFNEPSAPDVAANRLNAIELVYRISPSSNPVRQSLPEGTHQRRGGAAWPLPSGDRFVNTCGGLAPGFLLIEKGYAATRQELERRALAHWHWLQETHYPEYEFDSFSAMLAIRESHRVVGEVVLTEHDLLAGIESQRHRDIIATADHPMDTHGAGGGLGNVATPYGIPFRCLIPKGGWRNLLVACRGASFSHIAASSCRLSRTIMALGHAAGLAAAQCTQDQKDLNRLDVAAIQKKLDMPPR